MPVNWARRTHWRFSRLFSFPTHNNRNLFIPSRPYIWTQAFPGRRSPKVGLGIVSPSPTPRRDFCSLPMDYDKAHSLFREAVEDSSLCSWCFHPKKILHPEYDEAEAKRLSEGDTEQMFYAKGHNLTSEREIIVNYSTADPHPSTVRDTPPSTWYDGTYRSAAPQNICQCGTVDYGLENRSLSHLHSCLDRIVEWYWESELPEYPDSINEQAAHNTVSRLRQYDNMVGKDEVVLTTGIWRGFVEG